MPSIIGPVGISSGEAGGVPAAKNADRTQPTGLASAGALGVPTVAATQQNAVLHTGISSQEGPGVPAVSGGVLATTTTTTTPPPPTPGFVNGLPATLPQAVDALVAGSGLRKKTRFTRLPIDYPLFATAPFFRLPYNGQNGLPTLREAIPLRNIASYQIQEADNLACAQVSLTAQNSEAGTFSAMIAQNELLRIEERYSNAEGWNTGWITVGHYLIDAINPSAGDGKSTLDITGRDIFKLLTFPGCEEWLAADKIHVARKQLQYKVQPHLNNTSYYVLVDGQRDHRTGQWVQTYNWASPPVPRLWKDGTNERINYRDGVIQLLYGTGEIIIDGDFLLSRVREGGLQMDPSQPPHIVRSVSVGQYIQIEYSRYCLPEDERLYTVAGLSRDGLTLTLNRGRPVDADVTSDLTEPLHDWQLGLSVVVLRGNAQNQRHQIVAINPSAMQVTLKRDARSEGLALGDLVRVGEANRLEHALERLLLAAGFQNSDPAQPLYMEIAKPKTSFTDPARRELQITVPTVEDFDFRGDHRVTFLAAYEKLRDLMPPFMQLYADPAMRIVYAPVGQSVLPKYTLASDISQGQIEASDAEIMTRVIYYVRDKSPVNLAYINNKPNTIADFKFYNSPLAADPATHRQRGDFLWRGLGEHHSYAQTWFQNHYDELQAAGQKDGENDFDFFTRLVQNYICDNQADSSLTIENDATETSQSAAFDGLPVFHIGFFKPLRLKAVHFSIWPWNRGLNISELMFWSMEWSADGQFWEPLGDEFGFGQESRKILTQDDFGIVDIQWLRFSISKAATWRVDRKPSPLKVAFASCAGLQVYADDVIQGVAELGVDRFDLQTEVTAAGNGFFEIALPIEARWLTQPIWVEPLGQIAPPTGFAGKRFFVNGDPTASGVGVGSTVLIEQGETAADYALDQARRRRLGQRTYTIPTVDEVGYYIVQQRQLVDPSYTLLRYAQDKAREYLAEVSQEFFPLTVTGIRPDMRLRDTATLDLARLGFAGDALIREVTRNGDGTLQCKATPFRAAAVRTYSASVSVSTTVSETSTASTTDTTTGTTATTTTTTTAGSTTTTISTQAQHAVTLGGRMRAAWAVDPTGIASAGAFGTANVQATNSLPAPGIASAGAFGVPNATV